MNNTSVSSSIDNLVVVANRLPADITIAADGSLTWKTSPGGLVTALKPIVATSGGSWVGWAGNADEHIAPFDADGMKLIPIELSAQEVTDYYEGFSNATLWPLFHDAVMPPRFRRVWWDAYQRINRRFAEATAATAAQGAPVWVQDYQLMLVPQMLRELRPDLRIGFFNHIPFPPGAIYNQLPWRKDLLEGVLGADVIGFQRVQDARAFHENVTRLVGHEVSGDLILLPEENRRVIARDFPISIDTASIEAIAGSPEVQAAAKQIRADLGDPDVIFLGVDRLDYTKGIFHRLKAYGELLAEGRLQTPNVTFVQAASPSRQNVSEYQDLRLEIEQTVSRINGEFSTLRTPAIHYLYQSFDFNHMVALYVAADVMVVTPVRDGMNLVAKEYVASQLDDTGSLVLSEFAGAADELKEAFLVNPHDVEGMKNAFETAAKISVEEAHDRMSRLRAQVRANDVHHWAQSFLLTLQNS